MKCSPQDQIKIIKKFFITITKNYTYFVKVWQSIG